jgi:hypothetical protein
MTKMNGTAPTDNTILKSYLDEAWAKIEKGLQQEGEGRKNWIDGTLALINILHDARERFPSDNEFGKWLSESGYGESRISRQDRAALLNMALHPAATRKALEETHRRSWRLIWEQDIQPGLPNAGQPADGESTEEVPAVTRRRKNKKPPQPEWSKDLEGFFSDGLTTANRAVELQKSLRQCAPEKKRSLQNDVTSLWLDQMEQGLEALEWICNWAKGSLDEEANSLIQQGRVIRTPTRAAKQPEARQ